MVLPSYRHVLFVPLAFQLASSFPTSHTLFTVDWGSQNRQIVWNPAWLEASSSLRVDNDPNESSNIICVQASGHPGH